VDDDPDDEEPDGGVEGEEDAAGGPLELVRRILAWLATEGTVSARPVASRMSEGDGDHT